MRRSDRRANSDRGSLVPRKKVLHDAIVLQERADKVGIVTSILCAVHCAAAAALVGATGATQAFVDERIEVVFALIAILIAAFALAGGFKRHRRILPIAVGAGGVMLLLGARVVDLGADSAEVVLSVVGAATLVGAHGLNLRSLRGHDACCAPNAAAHGQLLRSETP